MSTDILSLREKTINHPARNRRSRDGRKAINPAFPSLVGKTDAERELRWQFPLGFISWKASAGYVWYGLEGDPWMEFMTSGTLTLKDGIAIVHERHPDTLVPVTPSIFQSFFGDLEAFPQAFGYYYAHFTEPFIAPDGERFATLLELKRYTSR